jgi:NAD(P)-dependent dehydrogenase (short-subunit alcohol dehydrogenase family)
VSEDNATNADATEADVSAIPLRWVQLEPVKDRNVVRSDNLDGKVAIVTGGASGIGAGVARRLAAGGARVVVADVDDDLGEALATEIGGRFLHTDVRRPEDSQAAVALAEETWGGLDLVHLNAGVTTGTRIDDFDVIAYRRAMGVNLDGVVFGTPAAVPALHRRGGGTIIATASMAGIFPMMGDPFYSANKHAVVGFCRSLGKQLWPAGIWVNAICPGFTDTPILGVGRQFLEQAGQKVLSVEDVVEGFIVALDTPHSGEIIHINAGEPPAPVDFHAEGRKTAPAGGAKAEGAA